jgi:hypothetical protein
LAFRRFFDCLPESSLHHVGVGNDIGIAEQRIGNERQIRLGPVGADTAPVALEVCATCKGGMTLRTGTSQNGIELWLIE